MSRRIVIELRIGKVDPTLPRYGTDSTATRLSVSNVNPVAAARGIDLHDPIRNDLSATIFLA